MASRPVAAPIEAILLRDARVACRAHVPEDVEADLLVPSARGVLDGPGVVEGALVRVEIRILPDAAEGAELLAEL